MTSVFILLALLTLNTDARGTFNLTVLVENICVNIYDHVDTGSKQSSSISQLILSYFAFSGNELSFYHYSSDLYPWKTNTHFFPLVSVSTPLKLYGLSVANNLTLTFYVANMLAFERKPGNSIMCPNNQHLFREILDPRDYLNTHNVVSSTNIAVNISSMICGDSGYTHNCDGHMNFSSSTINLKVSFTCWGKCSDLLTTTTSSTTTPTTTTATTTTMTAFIPTTTSTTTTNDPTTTTTTTDTTPVSPTTTHSNIRTTTTDPKPVNEALIAVSTIATVELVVIGIVVVLYLRSCMMSKDSRSSNLEPEENNNPIPGANEQVHYNAINDEVEAFYDNPIVPVGTTVGEDEPGLPPVPPRMYIDAPVLEDPAYMDVNEVNRDGANNDLYG